MSGNKLDIMIERWAGPALISCGKIYQGYSGELSYFADAYSLDTADELETFDCADMDSMLVKFNELVNKYEALERKGA